MKINNSEMVVKRFRIHFKHSFNRIDAKGLVTDSKAPTEPITIMETELAYYPASLLIVPNSKGDLEFITAKELGKLFVEFFRFAFSSTIKTRDISVGAVCVAMITFGYDLRIEKGGIELGKMRNSIREKKRRNRGTLLLKILLYRN
jgi:hypothetical protein